MLSLHYHEDDGAPTLTVEVDFASVSITAAEPTAAEGPARYEVRTAANGKPAFIVFATASHFAPRALSRLVLSEIRRALPDETRDLSLGAEEFLAGAVVRFAETVDVTHAVWESLVERQKRAAEMARELAAREAAFHAAFDPPGF